MLLQACRTKVMPMLSDSKSRPEGHYVPHWGSLKHSWATKVEGEEVQASSMWQLGEKDLFLLCLIFVLRLPLKFLFMSKFLVRTMWPQTPDVIFYHKKDWAEFINNWG